MKRLSGLMTIPLITILLGANCSGTLTNKMIIPEVIDKEKTYDINPKNKKLEIKNEKEDYNLLEGRILEFKNKEYITRIADRNLDGKIDNYEIRNTDGKIILSYFRNLKTNRIYSKCIFFGKILNGKDIKLEDNKLEFFNYVLKNPEKHGFKEISRD